MIMSTGGDAREDFRRLIVSPPGVRQSNPQTRLKVVVVYPPRPTQRVTQFDPGNGAPAQFSSGVLQDRRV